MHSSGTDRHVCLVHRSRRLWWTLQRPWHAGLIVCYRCVREEICVVWQHWRADRIGTLEDELWSASCSSSCWGTGDSSRICSNCCSTAKGWERRSQEDRERRLQERDLGHLLGQEVEDLEQEERQRWLGDIRLVPGHVRRPQGDRHAPSGSPGHAGQWRLTREGGTCPGPTTTGCGNGQ